MVVMVLHLTTLFFPFLFLFFTPKLNYISREQKNTRIQVGKKKRKSITFQPCPPIPEKVTARLFIYLPTYIFPFWYEMMPCLFPQKLEIRIYIYLSLLPS